ncbi:MAG: PIN domain-containing protein [Candidatus Acidiferrum sp.]
MSRIFWDTNLYIYLFEEYGAMSGLTATLRSKMLERGDRLFTSALTLGEILVKPTKQGDAELCRRYQEALAATSSLIPLDAEVAVRYAELRCDRTLRAPDAIQLASAASAGMDLFITNDQRLQGKHIDGIQFIVSLDRAPL